jgi:hypothetical protein
MKEQNYKNHRRIVPLYHGFAFLLLLVLVIGSAIHFNHTLQYGKGRLDAAMMLLASVILVLIFFYARLFALRAQDRAYDEFIELAKRTASENMSQDDIKKAVQNWRADHHRA